MDMRTQYVTDVSGRKVAVILPIKKYNEMMDELEELEDIKLYDQAKEKKQEFVDAVKVFRDIEENRRIKDV